MDKPIPIYEKDFYSDEFIRSPYPEYELMREMGPVVYVEKLGNFAFTHYDSVKYALKNNRIFIGCNEKDYIQKYSDLFQTSSLHHTRFSPVST